MNGGKHSASSHTLHNPKVCRIAVQATRLQDKGTEWEELQAFKEQCILGEEGIQAYTYPWGRHDGRHAIQNGEPKL
jgi:hypothetical protein